MVFLDLFFSSSSFLEEEAKTFREFFVFTSNNFRVRFELWVASIAITKHGERFIWIQIFFGLKTAQLCHTFHRPCWTVTAVFEITTGSRQSPTTISFCPNIWLLKKVKESRFADYCKIYFEVHTAVQHYCKEST